MFQKIEMVTNSPLMNKGKSLLQELTIFFIMVPIKKPRNKNISAKLIFLSTESGNRIGI